MNENDQIELTDLGSYFVNNSLEIPAATTAANDSGPDEQEVVIGSLLFDRDGGYTSQRRPRVRSSSIL